MADSDDGSLSRRDSHYNQQRSSLPSSSRSGRTPPRSRPQSRPHSRRQSSQLLNETSGGAHDDYTLRDAAEIPSVPSTPSPAPVIPRRKQSLDKGKQRRNTGGSASRHGSSGSLARTGSRGRNIDELLSPAATLEEERGESRHSKQRRSRRSSKRLASGRGTPATDFDITALPTISDNRGEGEYEPSKWATELYALSYLIFFSILGTLARLGLQWLTFYPDTPVTFSVLWANVAGTLFMGFLAEDRRLFRDEWGTRTPTPPRTPIRDEEKAIEDQIAHEKANHSKVKKTIPLYIGLATGFCGSFTSFSSFLRDMFLAFVNDLPSPANRPASSPSSVTTDLTRNSGYSFMAGIAIMVTTVALSFAALKFGAHVAILLDPITPTFPFRFTRRFLDPLIVIVGWGAWLGAVFMAIWPPDRPGGPSSKGAWSNETWRGQAIFACVFAPLGCLLRFYASLRLNSLAPAFPLGTFTVNIFGTAVLAMAYDLQHVALGSLALVGGGRVGCQVLQGIMDGFCGCLTTVSTWILEIDGLRRWHAYVYAMTSVSVGLAVLVVVMGSVRWTVGWTAVACVT
ncbi:hypothetical protein BU26DRAFT_538925 [Trematosphaeria pertusa]|uniref:Chromosome condensation protein-like protein n=1 Tax=Trematosphaeria pertusa TaxID=390896 RepID=A0A6A6INK5_9PLEO|nr:uncharacterized protein BU26DRAFT_538925 [Trematosphaeria pertusa]KAF2252144.1 hypothetical protein BU26DRAFT_538925 [Trematosphaeria pertusa]